MYSGFPAVEMESDTIKATVVPELGAKIVSLCYKPTGKEWLVDAGRRRLEKVRNGANFADADMSGWDECFPTIDPCLYPVKGKYEGVALPDHGEVWSIPWSAEIHGDQLICRVKGMKLPYVLTRRMRLTEQSVCFDYEVDNLADEPLSCMWTAHPQFATTPDTRIRLSEEVRSLLCVYGGKDLQAGSRYDWPHSRSVNYALDRIGSSELGNARKLYADGPVASGFAELLEQDTGEYLRFEWHHEEIPYLGIWIDEGKFNERSVCALEPSTGYYDRLTEAVRRGTANTIGAGESIGWRLRCRLGCQAPRSETQSLR